MDFWTNLTALARSRGLSISELAKRANVARQTLYEAKGRAEAGGAPNLDEATARRLAHVLAVSIGEIRGERPTDTLSAAKQAASLLVRLDGIEPDDAWLVMRDATATEGSVQDFYEAARIQLQKTREASRSIPPQLERRTRDAKLAKNGSKRRKVLPARKHRDRK